jgi:DNA-binding CsgD family transcriptional regulator
VNPISEFNKHISFLACSDINEICKPLFAHTPITAFEYSKVYPDGSRAELSNHAAHMRNAFITRAKMSRVYTPALIPENNSYLLITNWIENMTHPAQKYLQEQLNSQHELFGLGNELTIIKRHKDYVEYFHFYAASNTSGMENFYINNIELLEQFILYFINTARIFINKADANRLLKPWREQEEIILPPNAKSIFPNVDKKSLIKSITPKRLFLNVQGRDVYLTKREIDCANLVTQGKMNRAIAETLFISHRTVETHIESLKAKTNCKDRSSLINFLLASGFF